MTSYSEDQRLHKKAAFCILIVMKLFPDASDLYIEHEASKMMQLSYK